MNTHTPTFDIGFIGHSICIFDDRVDFPVRFPVITSSDLAQELAAMLREAMPEKTIAVEPMGLFSIDRAETEAVTERIKRRVIEARQAQNPGKEFLQGIGYWPYADQIGKE